MIYTKILLTFASYIFYKSLVSKGIAPKLCS